MREQFGYTPESSGRKKLETFLQAGTHARVEAFADWVGVTEASARVLIFRGQRRLSFDNLIGSAHASIDLARKGRTLHKRTDGPSSTSDYREGVTDAMTRVFPVYYAAAQKEFGEGPLALLQASRRAKADLRALTKGK